MNIIQPFDEKSKCPACGWGSSATTFHGITRGGKGESRSYMMRSCYRCGHGWRELPLYIAQATESQKVEVATKEVIEKGILEELRLIKWLLIIQATRTDLGLGYFDYNHAIAEGKRVVNRKFREYMDKAFARNTE